MNAPDALVRPWRTATLVASAVAAIELVILVVVGVGLLAKPVANEVRQAAEARVYAPVKPEATPQVEQVATPKLDRRHVSVVVLNGTGRTGIAASEAARLAKQGYRISAVGNAPTTGYTRSLVMFRKGFAAEAARLARDAHVKIVGPLDGMRAKDLHGAHVVVVLGA